jgi:hypothetical protein
MWTSIMLRNMATDVLIVATTTSKYSGVIMTKNGTKYHNWKLREARMIKRLDARRTNGKAFEPKEVEVNEIGRLWKF